MSKISSTFNDNERQNIFCSSTLPTIRKKQTTNYWRSKTSKYNVEHCWGERLLWWSLISLIRKGKWDMLQTLGPHSTACLSACTWTTADFRWGELSLWPVTQVNSSLFQMHFVEHKGDARGLIQLLTAPHTQHIQTEGKAVGGQNGTPNSIICAAQQALGGDEN